MTLSNRNILEQHRPKLYLWINDNTCHLDINEKQQILNVIRAEFNPVYQVDLWCGHCVAKMLEYAFKEMDSRTVVNVSFENKKKT